MRKPTSLLLMLAASVLPLGASDRSGGGVDLPDGGTQTASAAATGLQSWWWQDPDAHREQSTPDGARATRGSDGSDVTLCHYPPTNPTNPRTLMVAPRAVPRHLAHGDTLGPCPGDETPTAP